MRPPMTALGLAVAAAVAVAGCAGPSREVRAFRAANDASDALDRAEAAIAAVEPEAAGAAVDEAAEALAAPEAKDHPEHELLLSRLDEARKGVLSAQREHEKRAREAAIEKARDGAVAALEASAERLAALASPSPTESDVNEATEAIEHAAEVLEQGASLEPADADYAAWAGGARKRLADQRAELARGTRRVAFREGPVAAHAEAARLEKALPRRAGPDHDPERREALEAYRRCVEEGGRALAQEPPLGDEPIAAEAGPALAPKAHVARCEARAEKLQKLLDRRAKPAAAKRPKSKLSGGKPKKGKGKPPKKPVYIR